MLEEIDELAAAAEDAENDRNRIWHIHNGRSSIISAPSAQYVTMAVTHKKVYLIL